MTVNESIDWTNEPDLEPVYRAAIVWWQEHTGGSGFDDVYTIDEFLTHIRSLIEAPLRAEIEELSSAAEEAIQAMREHTARIAELEKLCEGYANVYWLPL